MPTNPTSPSLQPGDAVVERAVSAFWSPTPGNFTERMERGLTAALRLDDPETVERVARALHSRGGRWSGWELDMPESYREQFREEARAAISALLADPEEAEGGE